ncbi:sporulation protein YunB [Neobacillus fumarioli]|uniref:sporulation protein YunB n=1 Tax=Neobacillus fumarioli TaxID=105229 RepID=UPI00083656F8|nr:sporulation protein YunB [Neobacillus fumarioli]
MMRFKKFKRRGPLPFKYVFLLSFLFFLLFSAIGLWIVNKNITPALMTVASTRARQFASDAITDAISKKITDNIDINKLIIIHNADGEVSYSFNPQIYNRAIADSTKRVEQYLNYLETGDISKLKSFTGSKDLMYSDSGGGVIYKIPIGEVTNTAIFANMGPKIPVRYEILGDVNSDIQTAVRETGINNTYLEVNLIIKIKMNVIIPYLAKETDLTKVIKIGDLFVQGKVPQYYNQSGKNGIPIAVPSKSN